MTEKTTLGRLPDSAFGTLVLPAVDPALIDGIRALHDLTGSISDALDECGYLHNVIDSTSLRPTQPGTKIVGRALTLLNVPFDGRVEDAVAAGNSLMADIEAHNLSEPGDVLVIQGVDRISNMGSIMASLAKRHGQVGAIVDGAVRDVDHSREIGYPIWSRSISPITGKWRIRTVAVNVAIEIEGVIVSPGDIVAADEVGVCIIPLKDAEAVLAAAQRHQARDERRAARIGTGMPIMDVMATR